MGRTRDHIKQLLTLTSDKIKLYYNMLQTFFVKQSRNVKQNCAPEESVRKEASSFLLDIGLKKHY